jgi:hypothetical protein
VEFDEQVFDFAADAVKKVTGERNITGGDDIIRDNMRSLADNDDGENLFAEESKAAPPVDAQITGNQDENVEGQEVEEVEEVE